MVYCVYSLESPWWGDSKENTQYTFMLEKLKEIILLALWLTLISSNYPCLKHLFMVPKVFEPLKFDCNLILTIIKSCWTYTSWFIQSIVVHTSPAPTVNTSTAILSTLTVLAGIACRTVTAVVVQNWNTCSTIKTWCRLTKVWKYTYIIRLCKQQNFVLVQGQVNSKNSLIRT